MKVFFALLAIVVVTQASAGTINNIGGDISKVAVAGHEALQNIIHRLENVGDGAHPEPFPEEEIDELKHKHKHHHRDLEVEDINRNKFANGIDKINGLFVKPQPLEEEAEELKHKHHKHHRRDFDGISVESSEFQLDEIQPEPQPLEEEAEELKHKHKHHKHHRRDFDDISIESAEFQFDEIQPETGFHFNGIFVEPQPFLEDAEELKHKHKHHKHHRRSFDDIQDFSNGINFNLKFQKPQPIVEDAEQQKHKHHIGDFIDQVYKIQNEIDQIKDDIHDAINTAHELVNNVHNVIHPRGDAESKNLVTDGATIIPELAHMGEEVIKALQNLVNNLVASQSLMADDAEAVFL